MATFTIRTSAGDFNIRGDEHTTEQEINMKVARRLGYSAARSTNSGGARGSYQLNLGKRYGDGMSVSRTITVYR